MEIEIIYSQVTSWPCLAWLAVCKPDDPKVKVFHGANVETNENFFCEAAWDGEFEAGDFDSTDIVFGSGAKVRESKVNFVSSGSTLDRLQYTQHKGDYYISNSLACLLSQTEIDLNTTYSNYYEDFYSICAGINKYKSELEVQNGEEVRLIYYRNLKWDGTKIHEIDKPFIKRDFSSYAKYQSFLRDTMERFSLNLSSNTRSTPYEMFGTISSGYDSPTVTALASDFGCKRALCFETTHQGIADAGTELAAYLNIEPILVPDDKWLESEMPEGPFISANTMGEEVRFKGAEKLLANKVLLTGYHGDKVWAKSVKDLSPDIVRGDPSGLGLSEYRLWAGFINAPIPFWGARQIEDLIKISNNPEMQPWDLPGDYSRPICRRFLEQKGIPRQMFGTKKLNASVIRHNDKNYLSEPSLDEYMQWLRNNRNKWTRKLKIPPIGLPTLDRLLFQIKGDLSHYMRNKPVIWRSNKWLERPNYVRRFTFAWAMEHAKNRYRLD